MRQRCAKRLARLEMMWSTQEVPIKAHALRDKILLRIALAKGHLTHQLLCTMKSHLLAASILTVAAAGCSPNNAGSTLTVCSAISTTPAIRPPGWTGSVITIVMENKSQSDIIGNSQAPYINQLAKANTLAAGYHDPLVHPSEPNYLWMASGENFDVLDDNDPASHHIDSRSHVVDQVEASGLTWKAYEESMGAACGLTSHGRYAAKHDPFVYFNDVNGWDGTSFHPDVRCAKHVVDYSQLEVDLAANALPDYVFITPNLDNDMHDGSIAAGDAWLSREVPKLMASDSFKQGGVIFVLWDEGGGTPASDDPPFIAISPNVQAGMVSQADYDTSSYVKTVEAMLGVTPLPCDATAATVPVMSDLFKVPMTTATAVAVAPTPAAPGAALR